MKKIITAIGSEKLNNKLKKEKDFEIIFNDIQYKEGIIEILENNQNLDFIILSIILPGEISIKELVQKILEINKKIKIILISENKNENLEKYLYNKGVFKIIYDNEIKIEDLIKIIKNNKDSENEELKEEIKKLKNIILEKNKKENKKFLKKIIEKINNKINKIKSNFSKKINKKEKRKKIKETSCIKKLFKTKKDTILINIKNLNISAQNKTLIIKYNSVKNIERNNEISSKEINTNKNLNQNNFILSQNLSKPFLNLEINSKIKKIKIFLE